MPAGSVRSWGPHRPTDAGSLGMETWDRAVDKVKTLLRLLLLGTVLVDTSCVTSCQEPWRRMTRNQQQEARLSPAAPALARAWDLSCRESKQSLALLLSATLPLDQAQSNRLPSPSAAVGASPGTQPTTTWPLACSVPPSIK